MVDILLIPFSNGEPASVLRFGQILKSNTENTDFDEIIVKLGINAESGEVWGSGKLLLIQNEEVEHS